MATTFTKIGSKVLITKTDPAESYLVEATVNIRTETRLKDKIIITEKLDVDSDAGIVVNINDITNIDFTDMADLLSQLATDFFFRVASSVGADGFLYLPTSISTQGIRIGERTGWVIAYDRALTPSGFSGIEGIDWENFDGIEIVTV